MKNNSSASIGLVLIIIIVSAAVSFMAVNTLGVSKAEFETKLGAITDVQANLKSDLVKQIAQISDNTNVQLANQTTSVLAMVDRKVADVNGKLDALNQAVVSIKSSGADFPAKVNTLTTQIGDVTTAVNALRNIVGGLSSQSGTTNPEFQKKIDSLNSQIQALSDKQAGLEAKLNANIVNNSVAIPGGSAQSGPVIVSNFTPLGIQSVINGISDNTDSSAIFGFQLTNTSGKTLNNVQITILVSVNGNPLPPLASGYPRLIGGSEMWQTQNYNAMASFWTNSNSFWGTTSMSGTTLNPNQVKTWYMMFTVKAALGQSRDAQWSLSPQVSVQSYTMQ